MKRMSVVITTTLTLTLFAGCGGGATDSADQPMRQETSAVPQQTLADVCEQIADTLPETDSGFPSTQPQRDAFAAYATDLRDLALTIDENSADSVNDFADAMEEVAEPPDGDEVMPNLEISEDTDEGIADMRHACEAVGASVFH